MRDSLLTAHRYLQEHFFARWLLANMAGWSLGLYLGSLCLSIVGGLLGLILGGALAGGIAGTAQWWALRGQAEWAERRWLWLSAAGGAVGVLPAVLAGFTLVLGWGWGFCFMGALFGGVMGAAQMLHLNAHYPRAGWWIAANIAGGALCGLLSLGVNPLYLPVCCTLGPLVFGVVTGYTLLRLAREEG